VNGCVLVRSTRTNTVHAAAGLVKLVKDTSYQKGQKAENKHKKQTLDMCVRSWQLGAQSSTMTREH